MSISRTHPAVAAKVLEGWDTSLGQPFEQVARLPRVFAASNRVEAFSATDRDGKYWLIRESACKLWLYSLDHSGRKIGRHYFNPDWLLRGSGIYRAIVSLNELIKSRKAAGELTLDIIGFQNQLALLRSTVRLVDPSVKIHLFPTEILALEYLCLALGVHGDARLYVHEQMELHGSDVRYRLPSPVPAPLSTITPALEVWQFDRGNLFDLRAPSVEIGPLRHPSSPVEKMKAFRRLFEAGLQDEVADSLDQYATTLRRI